MGKPKKNLSQQRQKAHKSKRKPQISKMNSSDDEQVQDIMTWGRKKQNYYKQDEDQYSSPSEEQQQAKKIYQNQYNNYLNDQDLYDIPVNKEEEKQALNQSNKASFEDELAQDQQQNLPEEYVKNELQWVLQLFKDVEFYQNNNLLAIYQKLLKSYLTVLISIKEFKIPYIQYHPIIPLAVEIKTKITKLMKKLTVVNDEEDNEDLEQKFKKTNTLKQSDDGSQDQLNQGAEQLQNQQDESESQLEEKSYDQPKKNSKSQHLDHCKQAIKSQKQQHKKGLQFYNQMKSKLQEQKKIKKTEKKIERQANRKPTFKEINQNQGRFASELILKNKGLIKKRKKIQGNSRVKLRKKFQKKKAIHRAKTGHFIRQNPGRVYQGQSNIKYGKIAGVKLK